jgi:ABC-type lipoprotein release transport system permease subunit
MLLKLAWRNLWRNKRRTLITLTSVFFAVVLSTLMMSFKEGVYVNMIESMVGAYTGHAQIHADGFWEDKTLDNSLTVSEELIDKIEGAEHILGYAPRIESFALAASEEVTKGALVVGVDPTLEIQNTALNERVIEGKYLEEDNDAVLLGVGLADFLKLGVGDTIILIGQGYHGASAAGKYPVSGIVKFGSPELSKQLVLLPLKTAQSLYDLDEKVTNLILKPEDYRKTKEVVRKLSDDLGKEYEVMTWQEMAPEMVNMIETDRMEGFVFMLILYMVISFGIFGTVLMMLAERRHEFGVLVAIGMKRYYLAIVVFFEVFIISICGAIAGMIGAFPLCFYFYLNPIQLGEDMKQMAEDYGMEAVLQPTLAPSVFLQQAIVVAIIAGIIGIYPLIQLNRMDAITEMRS